MRETDWRKTLEVVVKGLVGAVLALAGLWLLGWLLTALGALLLGIAGIIGALLRFLIPVAAIAGIVYFVVAQIRPKEALYTSPVYPDTYNPSQPVQTVNAAPVEETVVVAETSSETELTDEVKRTS
jgi:membrane-bound ClpP family serine protease